MKSKNIALTVKDLVYVCKTRRKNKFDSIIAITGRRGLGKSTLAFKIAKKIGGFRPKHNLIYDLDTLKKRMEKYDQTLVGDEAIYISYKRNWQKSGQVELVQQLNAYRDHRNVVILCIPNFWDLDKPIRDLIFLRIDVLKRGMAAVHKPIPSNYSADQWDVRNNEKVERENILGKKKPKFKRLSTFISHIKFKPLTEKEEELYQKIKDEKRNILYEQSNKDPKEEDKYKKIIEGLKAGTLTREGLYNFCRLTGTKYSTLAVQINRTLKDELKGQTLARLLRSSDKKIRVSEELEIPKTLAKNHINPVSDLQYS